MNKQLFNGAFVKHNNQIMLLNNSRPQSYGHDKKYYVRNLDPNVIPSGEYLNDEQFAALEPINASKEKELLAAGLYHIHSQTSGYTGADPEIFAFHKNNSILPAWEFLPREEKGNSLYWDGVQAEFKVVAVGCHEGLTDNVRSRLIQLHTAMVSHDPTAYLKPIDVVKLDKMLLLDAKDEHVKLGCSPSDNAYNIPAIEIGDYRSHKYRYAGCHFHHSATTIAQHCHNSKVSIPWFPEGTVVMMDKIAGLLLTALGRDLENPLRREAYGRPGEFRVPDASKLHLEYRTPGAFCLTDPAVYNFVADVCRFGYRMGLYADGREIDLPDVKDIILNCDADEAVKVLEKNKSFFMKMLNTIYYSDIDVTGKKLDYPAKTWSILTKGLTSTGRHQRSIVENWKLKQTDYKSYNNGHSMGWRNFVISCA